MTVSRRTVLSVGLVAASAAFTNRVAVAADSSSVGDPQPLAANPPPAPISAPASVAKLAGVDLWYWDSGGEGPALVLLHPATGSGLVWGYQQAAFAAAGYRVIGYSRRGFSGSSAVDP